MSSVSTLERGGSSITRVALYGSTDSVLYGRNGKRSQREIDEEIIQQGVELKNNEEIVKKFKKEERQEQVKVLSNKRNVSGVVLRIIGGRNDKKFLLVKGKDYDVAGKWGFPKGKVEDGEHPKDAAYRELTEETGIVLSATEDVSKVVKRRGDVYSYVFYELPWFCVPEICIDQDEIVDYGFFDIDEMSRMATNLYTRMYISSFERSFSEMVAQCNCEPFEEVVDVMDVFEQNIDLLDEIENDNIVFNPIVYVPPIYLHTVFEPYVLESIEEDSEYEDISDSVFMTPKSLINLQITPGYGHFVNDHCCGFRTTHDYGCSENCTGCWPMNLSCFENMDESVREFWYDREYYEHYGVCICDTYTKCNLHHSNSATECDSDSDWESQMYVAQIIDTKKKRYDPATNEYVSRQKGFSKLYREEPEEFRLQYKRKNITKNKNDYFTFMNGIINCTETKRYMKTLRHGERRKVLTQLLQQVKYNLNDSYFRNNKDDFFYILKQCKFYNLKYEFSATKFDKFFAQGLFDLIIPEKIATTLDKLNVASDSVTRMTDMVTNLSGLLVPYSSGLWAGMTKIFVQFLSMGYLLSQPCNQNPANITAIIVAALSGFVPLNDLVDQLILAVKTAFNMVTQMGGLNLVQSVAEIFVYMFKSIFSTVDKAASEKFSIQVDFVSKLNKALCNIKNIVEFFVTVIGKLLEYAGEYLVKYYGYLPSFMKSGIQDLDKLVSDYKFFETSNYSIICNQNMEAANFVLSLYQRLLDMEETMLKKTIVASQKITALPYIRAMRAGIKSSYENLPPAMRNGGTGRRSKPFWIAIVGEPRIGKSTWFQNFIITMLAKQQKLITSFQDVSTYAYTRVCGKEFWDGYAQHPILLYDDLFQVYTNEKQVFEAIDELTHVVNDSVYHLNYSDVKDKKGNYMTSKIVISNMQKDFVGQGFISDKCLSNGTHLLTRRNVVAQLHLAPKYKLANGNIDVNKMALNRNYVAGDHVIYEFIPKDAYTVTFSNPLTGVDLQFPLGTGVDVNGTHLRVHDAFDFILNESADFFKQNMDIGGLVNDVCSKYFTQMYSSQAILSGDVDTPYVSPCGSPTLYHGRCCECRMQAEADIMELHLATVHALWWNCPFCISNWTDSMSYINHLVKEHKYNINCMVDYSFYCLTCQMQVDYKHRCDATAMVVVKNGIPVVYNTYKKENCRYPFIDVLPTEVDVNTINITSSDYLTGDQAQMYDNVLEASCRRCHEEFSHLIMANTEYVGPMMRKLKIHTKVEDCFITLGDIAKETIVVKKTLGDRCKEFFDNYTKDWYKFVSSPIFITVSSLFAIAGIAGTIFMLYKNMYKTDEDEELVPQGSGKKAAQRAASRRLRSKKRDKGKMSTIHEIDNTPLAIGKLGIHKNYDAQVYNNMNKDLEKSLSNNIGIVELVIDVENENKRYRESSVSFVNLWGSVFAIPKHFIMRLDELNKLYKDKQNVKMYVNFVWDTPVIKEVKIPFDDLKCIDPEEELLDSGHLTDVMFVYVPGINAGRDITKHFMSVDADVNLHGSYLYGYRSATEDRTKQLLNVNDTELIEQPQTYKLASASDPVYHQKVNEKNLTIPMFYWYRSNTIGGDCGMLLIHSDSSIPQKILGMHVAGSQMRSAGIAQPIFLEDLNDLRTFLKENYECQASVYLPENESICFKELSQNPVFAEQIAEIVHSDLVIKSMIVRNCEYNIRANLPMNTSIKPSVMYSSLQQSLGAPYTRPAQLRPFKNAEGEIVSPYLLALKKMQSSSPYIPLEHREEIVDHIASSICDWKSTIKKDFRVLTEYETFNGKDGLNPVDVTTSGGYPFKVMSKKTGKTGFIKVNKDNGKDIYTPTEELRQIMLDRENDAKIGKITETLFFDTLKDETRDNTKVDNGKTRMFQIGPMDLVLLTRKYCGAFIAHCHTTYLNGEMAIGINPYSDDWDVIARRLTKFNCFLNGDFSNFDATIGLAFAWMIVDIINRVYDDCEENKLIRAVLILTCFCSYHMAYDIIYTMMQGNPSGCALTTIFNCLVNMILVRLVYLKMTKLSLTDFTTHMDPFFYGDDNLIGMSEFVAKIITMENYRKVVATVGFTYTTPNKVAITKPYYTFDEVSFLTNTFKFVKTLGDNITINKYVAILDIETIHDIAFWSHSDPDNMMDQLNRVNMSLYYLRNHGREVFQQYRRAFVLAVRSAQSRGYSIAENQIWDWRRVMHLYDRTSIVFHDLLEVLDGELTSTLRETGIDVTVLKKGSNVDLDSDEHPRFLLTNNNDYYVQMADTETITTFVENENNVDMNEVISIQQVPSTFIDENLDAFLTRPHPISTVVWDSTQVLGTTLVLLTFPDAFFGIPAFKEKLSKFAFWAPDIEVTVRINGTGLHYGRLVGFWVPQNTGLSPSYTHYKTAFTHRWQQVDANGSNVITFHIPYTYYTDMITVGALVDDLATFRLNVSIPLSTISGTPAPVYVTTFIRVVQPRVCGYNYDNNFVAQSGSYVAQVGNKDRQETEKMGTLSNVVRTGGSFTAAALSVVGFGIIPGIVKRYTGLVANVLDFFGFSTPLSVSTTSPMQIHMPRLNKTIDTVMATNLALSQNYVIKDDNNRMYFNDDENDLMYFCSRPGLLYTGQITSLNTIGEILYAVGLAPVNMAYTDYTGPATSPYACLPVKYIGSMFAYWRGSMKFTLSVICSNFHNCRLRILYIPYNNSGFSAVTELTGADVENIIMDLSDKTEITFTIPYCQTTDWRQNRNNGAENYNGHLAIQLINPLTSGSSPVTPIYYQLFMSVENDFQFSCPGSVTDEQDYYIAQVGTQVTTESGATKYYACSMECLKEAPSVCLGKPIAHVVGFRDTTNVVASVLSLVKMAAFVKNTSNAAFAMYPFGRWRVRTDFLDELGRSYLCKMEAVFRYKKGGYRVTMIPDFSGGRDANIMSGYSSGVIALRSLFSEPVPVSFPEAYLSCTGGFAFHGALHSSPYDVIVPYNSVFKLTTTAVVEEHTRSNTTQQQLFVQDMGHTTETLSYNYLISGADDFRLSFQLGIPLVST